MGVRNGFWETISNPVPPWDEGVCAHGLVSVCSGQTLHGMGEKTPGGKCPAAGGEGVLGETTALAGDLGTVPSPEAEPPWEAGASLAP